ncbi:MAG: hypothetical protein CMP70_01620 [Flavobacteriales bacterium]|nr:hypothetical protein [Flavobacteriales bacterium]|tara:strand:- start:2735 stop:3469 length:735 start_codon:yes stop_codon:yes gene_type:complete
MPFFFRFLYFIKRKIRSLFFFKKIHFIGDSHTEVFWDMEFSPMYFWRLTPKIKVVHGATATGLANPNSKTQALSIFENYLKEKVKKDDFVVFQLGEVDCGFTIWYRAEKQGLSVQEQTQLAIDNYSRLVHKSIDINGKKTIVCSAVLPTIQDGNNFGEVANLRKEVKANLKERTLLTLDFNRMLRRFAEKNCLSFIDLDQSLLNEKTNVIHSKFLHKDSKNHHLDSHSLAKIFSKELNFIISKF